jgi:hypothetical protein
MQTPNPYIAKLFEAFNKITLNRHDAAMITVATRLNNLKEDRSRLHNFVEAFQEEIDAKLKALSG